MTKVTIGQYYPAKSAVHELDPRTKLFSLFVFLIMLFIAAEARAFLLASLVLGLTIYASRVPMRLLLRGLRPIIIILTFTVAINILFTPGENVLLSFSVFTITEEGLILSLRLSVRLVLMIMASTLLTLTTTPIQLTDSIEYCLKPFRKIGVPSHEIAMMMSIALRFIPTLLEEVDKIMKAQMARGAEFDTGSLIQKAKSLIPVLIPLFVSSIRRAEELALAMEARCYRGDVNRTRMKQMLFKRQDYFIIVCTVLFAALIIFLRL